MRLSPQTLLILLLGARNAEASSAGGNALGYCYDATSPDIGCDPRNWVNGDHLKCTRKADMNWAGKPVYSSAFTLRTGTGNPNQDPKSYVPGQWMSIYLDVKAYGHKYRGLVVQANSNSNRHVGTWNLTNNDNAFFVTPEPGCVMHGQSDLKPLRVHFRYKAPPRGTGPITFKALIKVGPANTGFFYFPNGYQPHLEGTLPPGGNFPGSGNDLRLTEAGPQTWTWSQAAVGKSCSEHCASIGKSCDEGMLSTEDYASPDGLDGAVEKVTNCPLPIMPSCTNVAPARAVGGSCWYNGAESQDAQAICQAVGGSTNNKATCGAKHAKAQRFCACK
mmetsp:Transcript_13783/g.27891  ORF Transcript_13783/g.27891 Transcript_13783/m.27891 type:complete len:333 (-) Transcript_13783:364-1362(-)|eukprot:CAMPEP_0167786436 /NCGR_PEP_ID=MMETSP0111_2-20121227/8796_1 /TAXON_ID=91324 /ORGANISM="Lotharella globosa, Strain CCCM811" /LENGTH=332 /DNA_ID=CAMNT_0007677827 /DNA_START=59 /DNA_END=1057 /DNA_ORIENTATION=-